MKRTATDALEALFWPKSIALIGASSDAKIIRGRMVDAILEHAFPGPIYAVSRSHSKIRDLACYPSVSDLPQPVDLAIITIPAKHVIDALQACVSKGIHAAVIISSGFAEENSDTGRARQQAISDIAAHSGMAIIGPNAEGFLNGHMPLAASFSPTVVQVEGGLHAKGSRSAGIAVISQSGGVGFSFFNRGRPKGLVFSFVVTTGNEAGLDALDVLSYLIDDDATKVVLMFIEGFVQPRRLAPIASQAARLRKPLIIAKVGHSEAAAAAAVSHTASLAGSHSAYRAVFSRYGIINGNDSDHMIDVAAAFAYFHEHLPRGTRVGILTPSGGAGAWLADQCDVHGLHVPKLDCVTRAKIDAILPAYGASRNPVDVTAQVIFKLGYAPVLEIMAASPSIDAILVVGSLAHPTYIESDFDALVQLGQSLEKPIIFCAYTRAHPRAVELLAQAGFPCLENMSNAAQAIKAMADYAVFLDNFDPHESMITKVDSQHAVLDPETAMYTEHQAKEVLVRAGVDCPLGILATSPADAVTAAAELGLPVALKLQSRDIPHKTESGGVALNLIEPALISSTYTTMVQSAHDQFSDARIDGVRVERMAGLGIELIVGVHHDHDFGLLLSVGSGGILVEVLNDIVTTPLPVSHRQAKALVSELRCLPLLKGVRGQSGGDMDALVNLLVTVSQFSLANKAVLATLDLNPVIVHAPGKGITVADALITTRSADAPPDSN